MQMMMLQLAYADQQLKRVTDRMKELGIWEKSLFVVTADHGGAFNRSGSRRILTDENAGWVLPVPLLIKSPGQTKAKVVRGPADSRDIAPTMLGALGLEPGDEATGRDLTGLDRLPPRDTVEARGVFGKVDFDRSTIVKEHAKARDYRNQLFPGSLYAVGGHENLIGQKPVGLRRLGFEIVFPENYTDVVTEGGYVPSWVQGSLTDVGQPPPESVAVALNGEIVAIAPVWTTAGVAATGVIVPGRDFVDGANEIAVYEIPGSQAKGG